LHHGQHDRRLVREVPVVEGAAMPIRRATERSETALWLPVSSSSSTAASTMSSRRRAPSPRRLRGRVLAVASSAMGVSLHVKTYPCEALRS
jgi:hypothetical protein